MIPNPLSVQIKFIDASRGTIDAGLSDFLICRPEIGTKHGGRIPAGVGNKEQALLATIQVVSLCSDGYPAAFPARQCRKNTGIAPRTSRGFRKQEVGRFAEVPYLNA